ncbi:hypothetical protein [Massilia pseudoviolaceinigra]|uniref:hypothetical protein n=1 Tax=Massilia pseudoviolaceinigra TaxID=3057165 RepID=UPI0027964425|nr:hypothetical protein [Massilia sp. CCM 9206]MDQ1921680.1 hypothetical protein [Massilia sp. CCM 9206]
MTTLAERLIEAMDDLELEKPVDLARYCGVSEGLVSQWFSGATSLGPKPLKAFARKSKFSLDWLTDGKLPKFRPESASSQGASAVIEETMADRMLVETTVLDRLDLDETELLEMYRKISPENREALKDHAKRMIPVENAVHKSFRRNKP